MNDYFSPYPGTPPLGVKGDYRCSVHYGNTYRYDYATQQSMLEPVPLEKIIKYVVDFLKGIGIESIEKKHIYKPEEIDYDEIKRKNKLADERDIVWMKFTKCGYLGVVATSNDINFNIPEHREEYDMKEKVYNSYLKKYEYVWKYNTSGILVHQIGQEWDTSFVVVFPLTNIPKKYNRGCIEMAIGNYLIDKGVPIIDFYSHNY